MIPERVLGHKDPRTPEQRLKEFMTHVNYNNLQESVYRTYPMGNGNREFLKDLAHMLEKS